MSAAGGGMLPRYKWRVHSTSPTRLECIGASAKAVAQGVPGTDPVCKAGCVRFIFSGPQNLRFSVLLENRGAALRGLGEEREMDEIFPRIFCN